MNVMVKTFDEAREDLGDRRTIRLDGPCPQAGIAAALRRAFEQASRHRDPVEDEFDRLLAQVH